MKTPAKLGATVSLSLAILLASLGTSIANIALPTLAISLNAPFDQVRWVVISYLASLTLAAVFAGRLGDIFGRRRMLLIGLAVFALASALCGLAPNLGALITARALQGAGAAFLMTLPIALVRETTGHDRVGRMMGMLGTMSAIGTALGPSLGGVLITTMGWRAIFALMIPLSLLAMALVRATLPPATSSAKSPLIRLSALRQSGHLPSLVANLLVAAVMMSTLLVGPFYLSIALGLRESTVGLVMAIGPVISIFSGVPSGRLVDTAGAPMVLRFGLFALIAGALGVAVLPGVMGLSGYILAIAVLTPGYQLFQAANNTAVMANVPPEQRGTISGILSLSRNAGLILGAWAMGAIFALATGTSSIEAAAPAAITSGMQATFAVATALMIAALWVASPRRQRFALTPPAAPPHPPQSAPQR